MSQLAGSFHFMTTHHDRPRRMFKPHHKSAGFTLIEVMLVIVVIGMMVAGEKAIQSGSAATHHILMKPCSDQDVIHAIERGLILRNYLRDPLLIDILYAYIDPRIRFT